MSSMKASKDNTKNLKSALRENLKKRKAQTRKLSAPTTQEKPKLRDRELAAKTNSE